MDNITTEQILKKAAFRISRARTMLMLGHQHKFIFWSAAALHLTPIPTIDLPTMGVDGKHLFYNPVTVASNLWNDDELQFIVAHEVDHCVKSHHTRRQWRDPQRWNIACDRTINPELVEAGLCMPKGALYDPADAGKAAERLYLDVTDDDVQKCFGDGVGDCAGTGTVSDAPRDAGQSQDAANDASAHEWDLIARQAAYIAQAQGHLPAGYSYLLQPKKTALDPRQILRDHITLCARDDYNWRRPNRRFITSDLYVPSLRSESVGPVFIAIDVSGSVSDNDAARALGFVDAVLQDVRPQKTWLAQCDAAVHQVDHFNAGERLPTHVTIRGRGGTDMRPVWAYQQQNNIKPACSIIISDMEMDRTSFGEQPSHPVLWISSVRGLKGPFGQTIEMPT